MAEKNSDGSYRQTLPDTPDEIAQLWRALHRVDQIWPWASAVSAVFKHWRFIIYGCGGGLLLIGQERLQAAGLWPW
jgi:hypothetical protein